MLAAVLLVATPVLAGRVVNVISDGGDVDVVIWLSVVIALIALLEAAVGLIGRWLSVEDR
ncbi:MAG: hypothetical protein WKF78_00260 [Candidatus Limnocylindrales bacterium]